MRILATDPAASRRLVAAGHARVRAHYEIGVVAERYRSLYRELAA
jgi:glycosyltransferase involved in cell wall biosynthesis